MHAPKPGYDPYTKLRHLTEGAIKEGATSILKLPYLNQRYVLRKNQKALSSRKKLRKFLKFDSGCTGWQRKPKIQLKINIPNFIFCLEEPF